MTREELFTKIITNYMPYMRYKVAKNTPDSDDLIQDSILSFYKYHLIRFEIERYSDEKSLFQAGRSYFFKRFFQYFKSFYVKKINKEKEIFSDNNTISNLLYSETYVGGEVNYKNFLCNKEKLSFSSDCVEDKLYLEQFKKYINRSNIAINIKDKIFCFMKTGSKEIFGTNFHYYKNLLNTLNKEFNAVNI